MGLVGKAIRKSKATINSHGLCCPITRLFAQALPPLSGPRMRHGKNQVPLAFVTDSGHVARAFLQLATRFASL
jgi:hypothetical protein